MSELTQNIICFPSVMWDHNWERQHEIIYRLARRTTGKVYIHQPYGMINDPFGQPLKKTKKVKVENQYSAFIANKSAENIQFIGGKFIPYHFMEPIDKLNAKLIEVQTPGSYSKSIVFATYLNAFTLKLFKKGQFKILDLTQRRHKTNEISDETKRTEEEAIRIADLVVTDSISTKRDYDHIRKDILHLPTGVDITRYMDPPDTIPALGELRQQWKIIAGYIGSDTALDEDALHIMITSFPSALFLLIGEFKRPEILELNRFPNVVMPGKIHSRDIPVWCSGFDFGLIPYAITRQNLGIFPTKFLEYLASGLPVLSSALPDVIAIANEAVIIYEHDETIPSYFKEMLFSLGDELSLDAYSLAKEHCWENIFEKYFSHIRELMV